MMMVSIKMVVVVMERLIVINISVLKLINTFQTQSNSPTILHFPKSIAVAYSPDAQLVSQPPFKYDASHVIRVENIPWTITKKSIVLFFAKFNVLNDEDGVHFIVDNVTNHNNAFIQLASSKDVQAALNREQLRVFKFLCKSTLIFDTCICFQMNNLYKM